jgi:hypothetical protein
MARALLPPTFEALVDDNKKATLTWASFFEGLSTGDAGTSWTPTFTGLTEVGAATKTGVYYRLSQKVVFFRITITPETSTTAVLGTTYCDNFPLVIANSGVCASISSFTANVSGVSASEGRIYTSAWSAITSPITLVGLMEVR